MAVFDIIDGPPSQRYRRFKDEQIARDLVESMEALGWWMKRADARKEKSQGYRMASWVQHHKAREGSALVLSRVRDVDTPSFAIQSLYYRVKRFPPDQGEVVKDVRFEVRSNADSERQAVAAMDVYDRRDMILVTSMLGKIGAAIETGDFDTHVDRKVYDSLFLAHHDEAFENEINGNHLFKLPD